MSTMLATLPHPQPLSLKQQRETRQKCRPRTTNAQDDASKQATATFTHIHAILQDIRSTIRSVQELLLQGSPSGLENGSPISRSSTSSTYTTTPVRSRSPSRHSSLVSSTQTRASSRADSHHNQDNINNESSTEPEILALRRKVQDGLRLVHENLAIPGLEKLRECVLTRFAEATAEIETLEAAFWASRQERLKRPTLESKRSSRMDFSKRSSRVLDSSKRSSRIFVGDEEDGIKMRQVMSRMKSFGVK